MISWKEVLQKKTQGSSWAPSSTINQQCTLAAGKAKSILCCIRKICCQQVQIKIIPLHSALLRHAWRVVSTHGLPSTSKHKHPRKQSNVGLTRPLRDWSFWHSEPESTEIPAWRRIQEILSMCIKTPEGDKGKQHFSLVPSNRVKGNGHKLKQIKFHLNKGKPFPTPWLLNSCPNTKLFY